MAALIAAASCVYSVRLYRQRAHAQDAAREGDRRLKLLLSQVPAVLWTVDRNLEVTSMFGGEPGAALSDDARAAIARALQGETVRFETLHNGRWLQSDVEPIRDGDGVPIGAAGVMLDITDVRGNAERFKELARQDALTSLPNRLALQERLPDMLANALETRSSVAVLFVDVDRFKTINDTLGHRIGDELLRAIAQRFEERLPENACVFRPGGDEFIVVIDRIKHKRTVASAAMDVLAIFSTPFDLQGRELFVTASVGASIYPKNADSADDLIAFADSAMYRAKESGRNNAKFYDGTMHAHVLERLGLEQDLRQALARKEIGLAFQPIVEIHSRRVVAAEALMRWNHPLLGELLPQVFIGIAEESGIIIELSRWLLREACRQAMEIRMTRAPDFRIAVNLSPRDFFEQDFPAVLTAILSETGLPASALDIEVTETAMLNELAVTTLARVQSMGAGIVVDDFGTGYSSLGYIKRLPVTAIKIDKTFIDDVTSDQYDQGIVKAITTLAQTLGLRVIAEGIETEAQWQFIRALNCEHAQGYLFHRPIAAKELLRIIPRGSEQFARVISLHR